MLRFTVTPRILDERVQVIWEKTLIQNTKAGKSVVVNLEAGGVHVRLTATAFAAAEGQFLIVVQGLIRASEEGRESLRSSVQSLLIPLGGRVFYYPLGRDQQGARHQMAVEIGLTEVLP